MTENEYDTLNNILNNIKRGIDYISDLSHNEKEEAWSCLYNIVFSKNVSRKVFDICNLYYCDPDTTYEDDILAFYNALSDHLAQLRPNDMTKFSGNIENDLNNIFGI